MATIKDVAQRAGVSLGTVSNVLNGKTKNQELIERVENAVEELGFRLDGKARSLKSTQTFLVGVLIGSLREAGAQTMISAIERTMQAKGYSVLVKVTDNNSILEKKYVESFIHLGVDGIIVDTGVDEKIWLGIPEIAKIPIVFMRDKPIMHQEMNYVCIDYEKGMIDFLAWCRQSGKQHVGLVLRDRMLEKEQLENICEKSDVKISFKLTAQNAPENGFKAAYELFYENDEKNSDIDMILAGSIELMQGIWQAADILGYLDTTKFACIKNENWIEDSQLYECILDVSFLDMGRTAAEKLLDSMQQNARPGVECEIISAGFKVCDIKRNWPQRSKEEFKNCLHVAILDSETANVLQMVSDIYMRKTGIRVIFHPYSYHELWHLIKDKEMLLKQNLDVVMYDIVWKEDLVRRGVLAELLDADVVHTLYFDGYIDNVAEAYGICQNKLYGLPFLTGTQLLFYQKDLFEDATLRRQFGQRYGYSLEPPKTWDEFLDIAEFFTQEYNPKSPVRYGTAMANGGNLYNSIELLNILWSMDDDIIKDGRLNLDSPLLRIALDKYKKCYKYASRNICASWEDLAGEFKTGRVAMVILYDSYAFGINDSMHSKVAGNIESAVIPGRSPVLGGWGIGCLNGSNQFLLAREFVKWVGGEECDKLYSVLAGISNRKNFYLNRDLDGLYPWKKDILCSYSISRERNEIYFPGKEEINMTFYDEILGKEIQKILDEKINIEDGIEEIWTQMKPKMAF